MSQELVRTERAGDVLLVTLDNAAKYNALSAGLIAGLMRALQTVEADASIRAVLLTGNGKAFCSGADLTEGDRVSLARGARGAGVEHHLREEMNPMILGLRRSRVPVVVAVNGIAAGAGVSLALAGDYTVAARSASFRVLFTPRLGLVPDMGATAFLTQRIGPARAQALSMTGAALTAEQAAQCGLIAECVDDAELLPRARALVEGFARGPTQAFIALRALIEAGVGSSLEQQLEREAQAQRVMADSDDFLEGVTAFREKREPRFNGR